MRLKTIIAFCMLSVAVYAQKAPKGQLLSYSHSYTNAEILVDEEFSLSWNAGQGILTIKKLSPTDTLDYTDEVSEDVFRQATDIIKAKKLYAIRQRKLRKKDLSSMPMNDPGASYYRLQYEDKHFSCRIIDLSDEQLKGFDELEQFIKDAVNFVQPPKGQLIECSLTNESTLPGKGGTFESLSVQEGQIAKLVFGRSTSPIMSEEDRKYIVSAEDVVTLQELILKEKLYKVARYDGDLRGEVPIRRVFLKYDDGKVYAARYQNATKDVARAERVITDFFNSLTRKYQPDVEGRSSP